MHPDKTALIFIKQDGSHDLLTTGQLERWANRVARRLSEYDVVPGKFVAIHFPNCLEHVVATLAIYKLGACPMPLAYRLPDSERDAMIQLASPVAIFSDVEALSGISRDEMRQIQNSDRYLDSSLPDAIPQPFKAIASGGSTGTPKLIVSPLAFYFPPESHPFALLMGIASEDVFYSPGPLYHNQAFLFTQIALFAGATAIINEKFDADRCLNAIHELAPTIVSVVPTMMLRMARSEFFQKCNFASIKRVWHMAAPCPEWVKQIWLEKIGAEKLYELWAATENTGIAVITGSEWLERKGSVGRGFNTEIRILDEKRRQLPCNEVGEIFTRFAKGGAQYCYLGAKPLETLEDDFASVGDLGYVDDEGYLFLTDRRTDLIISGGANIYPAEVESVILQMPGVADVVVIGLKDDDLGRRVHAVIQTIAGEDAPSFEELSVYVKANLSLYKAPKSYEILEALPRDEAGKIRRSKLRDERGG
nr:AMP-binding protein [Zhongshania aquimaris]